MVTPIDRVQIRFMTAPSSVLIIAAILLSSAPCFSTPANAQAASSAAPGIAPDAYRLVGTIGGSALSGAVLIDSQGAQLFYRLHAVLPNGSQLISIRPDSISVKGTDGTINDVYLSHDTKPSSASQPVAEIKPNAPAEPYSSVARPNANEVKSNPAPQQNIRLGRRGRTHATDDE